MFNQSNATFPNSSPRGTKSSTPSGGITVNLDYYDKLPSITTENAKIGITTTILSLPSLKAHEEKVKPQILPTFQPDIKDINLNNFTEETKNFNFTKIDFVWPVSSSVKPIKKKAVRLKPPQPIVIRPFDSLINTEDAVALLRKLQFY